MRIFVTKPHTMADFFWTIFGFIIKVLGYATLILAVIGFFRVLYLMCGGGRKWRYYDPSRPWKGGFYEPLKPSIPPCYMSTCPPHDRDQCPEIWRDDC